MFTRRLTSMMATVALAASLIAGLAPATQAAAASQQASVEACLVRSAIVPLPAIPEARADELREAAARSLQHALLLQHPDVLAGAEIERDAADAATGLRLVGVTDGPDAAALVPAVVAQLGTHLQDAAEAIEVQVAGVAEQPLTALCDAQDRAMQLGGDAGAAIISVAIDHRAASLRVGLDGGAPTLAASVTQLIESLPSALEDEQASAESTVAAAVGLADLGVPVELVSDVVDEPVSRMNDGDGYGGGNAIRVGALACTSGFAVRTADGSPAVMSAGHCSVPRGSNGASVVSGHAAQICGLGTGAAIGRVSQNLLAGASHVDSMLVRTDAARPTMWLGRSCTGSTEVAVHGSTQVARGASVGFSGTRQGERYATRTSEPAGCYDFGFWACATFRAVSSAAVPPSSGYACLPGDSGGPTFRHRSGGGVFALGMISASGYDVGINRCSWVDMGTALHLTGATIMTHTSMSIPAPARIAGSDRYETAALVSRRGYPGGAQQVYIASGQLFPDALSAGAAAAHVKAPLLLTTGGALPSSTRRELIRLSPESIVLVGGTPSVSAAVEASLSQIAPVRRIAGSDRFETSALIAQHAFPTGATEAFIATGHLFPDALAAGPAAATRGAPILLVDGTGSVSSHTFDMLDALDTTRLTIIGGTPSVSAGIEATLSRGRSVVRIAGANRYDTAMRVNQLVRDRPPVVYIAAGDRFPDALAASAVAGAQRAPLFLTPSDCLDSALPEQMRRLGTPPVVLLGGTPTLAPDVASYELCG